MLDLNIGHKEIGENLTITIDLSYKRKCNDEEQAKADVIIVGVFEIKGPKPEFYDNFCNINAPALIYPYLREHISYLTNKAGLKTMNLPPLNFVDFSREYFKKQKNTIEKAAE